MLKRFLHTTFGAQIGFFLGLKGYNRLEVTVQGRRLRSYNSRVNKGADLIASLITATTINSISSPLPPKYIALSTSSLTAAAGDTTLSGETSATGLARAAGTFGGYSGPASLDGGASFTVSKTFTNSSGGAVTIVSAALFDASSSGNLFVEANLASSAVLQINDQLAVTWTVNI